MIYVIGIVLLVIIFFIYGAIRRKRIYDAVDRLESWKISVMERDVAQQLSQIKSLNLLGETLEHFESWKERWDTINTTELYEVEEYLFDAESAADKYKFSQATKIIQVTENHLKKIEQEIDEILLELSELIDSEEKGRAEIDEIQPVLKELRKTISQKRYQFGKAEAVFDQKLDHLYDQVKQYYELVEAGDYIQASELVHELDQATSQLADDLEQFPEIYRAHRTEVPQQLTELKLGIKDMIDDDYHIKHFAFEQEIHTYEDRLQESLKQLEKGEIQSPKALLEEIDERLKEIYDTLEKEAFAKNFIELHIPNYKVAVEEIATSFEETRTEFDEMKQAYHLEDQDLEKYLALEKTVARLPSQLVELKEEQGNKEKKHSELRSDLENHFDRLDELKEELAAFHKQIYNLRKDEHIAKERLEELRTSLKKTNRNLKRSNLPGIPSFLWTQVETAEKRLESVLDSLDQQPIDIIQVQESLKQGEDAVQAVLESSDKIIQQAYLTEQVIQYANRYRGQDMALAKALEEAERLFRKYEYELSLEHAADAIEAVEPGALERIQAITNEQEEQEESYS